MKKIKCKNNNSVYKVFDEIITKVDDNGKEIKIPEDTEMAKRLRKFARGEKGRKVFRDKDGDLIPKDQLPKKWKKKGFELAYKDSLRQRFEQL